MSVPLRSDTDSSDTDSSDTERTASDSTDTGSRSAGSRAIGTTSTGSPSSSGPRSGDRPGGRRTHIAPSVVATVAGVAARNVPGVHDVSGGGGGGGALSRVRTALPGGGDASPDGVQVEVGEVQAAFDLQVVAEYGVSLRRLAGDVRERVIGEVEELTGYEVTEVNIAVVDVHLDDEDET